MSESGSEDVEALKAEVARLKAAQAAPPPFQPVQGGGGGGVIALLVALAVIGAAVVGGYYLASPFIALEGLKSAAKSGDRDRLARLVDFPTLRSNLKSELSAKMLKAMQDDPDTRDNGYAALGAVFAPAIVDRIVDAYVTPDTISAMVDTGKAPPPGSNPGAPQTTEAKLKTDMGYADLDHFRVKLSDAADPKNQITLVLERRDLIAWKLIRIDFDVDQAQAEGATSAAASAPSNAATADSAMQAAKDAASDAAAAASTVLSAPAATSLTPAAPTPVRRPVHRGPAPGTDAWACAHGDHSEGDVIEACDRARIRASGGE